MTKSLPQLRKQIAALERQAEVLQHKESKEVVARIKDAITFYNLSAQDLGFGGGAGKATQSASRPVKAAPSGVKYRDESGNTWGGRGPRPQWLRDALAAGRSLEEFLVNGAAPKASTGKRKPARGKKASGKIKYRDDAGHTWSGRGPKPRWLTEALARGATLQDLSA